MKLNVLSAHLHLLLFGLSLLMLLDESSAVTPTYFGKKIGSFKTYHHEVVGDIYAVDAKTIHIKGFSYDGQGPDAFFWAGTSAKPNSEGFIVPDEKGTKNVLQPYRNRDLTLTLPEGKTLNNIKWLSVWCRSFAANFADVFIPATFDAPKPQRLQGIVGVMHNTSSGPIVIVDAQTFMIPNFYLDGQAPDAHFWVGTGPKPSVSGTLVPDENGSVKPLGRYDGQSLVITLPGDLTVFDIDWLSVWCREFTVDFGHVKIPKNLNVPPSLKMLGVSPQSKLNCEVLSDELGFEVRWAKAGDTVVVQLVARLANGEYMSFGLSGDHDHSQMVGGDVVVAWIDRVGHGHAIDYILDDKAQCAGGRGSCPDHRVQPNTNTVRLLNAAVINGYVMITYQRPLIAVDSLDLAIRRNGSQPIIWAIGPLNSEDEASYHTQRNKADMFIDFGRTPSWNCPAPLTEPPPPQSPIPSGQGSSPEIKLSSPNESPSNQPSAPSSSSTADRTVESAIGTPQSSQSGTVSSIPSSSKKTTATVGPTSVDPIEDAWYIPPIECPEPQDNVFYAQIGPAGGKKGYSSITGHVGWGIAWYINGLLIPEITVIRGKTYTFVVEGGNDLETPARNHPFYITDDPVGGLGTKSLEEQEKVRVYAGVRFTTDGEPEPSAAGRLCEWVQRTKEAAEAYSSFGEYQRALELSCDKGQAAVLQWTPDNDTPDLVYYQCYTHRYLGWKIHVVDQCEFDHEFGSSMVHETNVSHGVIKQQYAANPLENTGRAFPDTKLVRVSGTMSSIGVSSTVGVGSAIPTEQKDLQFLPGFRPVATKVQVSDAAPPNGQFRPQEKMNSTFVKDPFVFNESVPFQAGFQPGEPQFGGFGASNFGQRFEKAPPVYVQKQMVPMAPIVPNLPSRLGSVFQPHDRRQTAPKVEEMVAAQHPVVFRAPAPADSIPPPPPKLPMPQRPPNGSYIRRRVRPFSAQQPQSASSPDGSRVSNNERIHPASNNQRPLAVGVSTKSFVPFKGSTPGPIPTNVPRLSQFGSGGQEINRRKSQPMLLSSESQPIKMTANLASAAEDPILTNVWSIINQEREGQTLIRNGHRTERRTRQVQEEEEEEAAAAEPEPTPEPTAEIESKNNNTEHMHKSNEIDLSNDKVNTKKTNSELSASSSEKPVNGSTSGILLNVFIIFLGVLVATISQ